jgi:hypothetical protein
MKLSVIDVKLAGTRGSQVIGKPNTLLWLNNRSAITIPDKGSLQTQAIAETRL